MANFLKIPQMLMNTFLKRLGMNTTNRRSNLQDVEAKRNRLKQQTKELIGQDRNRAADAEDEFYRKTFIFGNILIRAKREWKLDARSQEAREWLRQQAFNVGRPRQKLRTKGKKTRSVSTGKMYFFKYDPKHKKTLPFYDMFPLVFPIQYYDDGFLGLNMHYLPPGARAALMDALYFLISDHTLTEGTKLQISYQILSSTTKFAGFQPTIHRYLYGHVRSQFIQIHPKEWDIALFLPVAQWRKGSAATVYQQSMRYMGIR